MLALHTYSKSSAAYRVRIALGLKQLPWQAIPVNLLTAENRSSDYMALNEQGLVPTLVDDSHALTQSLAIIEYLEETRPKPALLPSNAAERALARALAYQVAMEIHPLQNLRVRKYLTNELDQTDQKMTTWCRHWMVQGFQAFEATLQRQRCAGQFCMGTSPGLADICLVPQVYNARRFDVDMSQFDLISTISQHCEQHEAFAAALPEAQADFQP